VGVKYAESGGESVSGPGGKMGRGRGLCSRLFPLGGALLEVGMSGRGRRGCRRGRLFVVDG
jgi:hypothetical protein